MPAEPQLTLHFHPLAAYCWKVLIALYEAQTPFKGEMLNGRPSDDAAFTALWPIAKMPVLQDAARGQIVPETSIIIDYLDQYYPGPARMIPADPDLAREVRLWDRIFDLYVSTPMQKHVSDRLQPEGQKDPAGVVAAKATLDAAYAMLEARMATRTWAVGEAFTLADCAALPALFYAEPVHPFSANHPALAAYLDRLVARPSVRRVLAEAKPWLQYFPFNEALSPRFAPVDR
jgi:glutathione S-transferase